jgi:transglutaminase-like putative cysteine protease
LTFEGSPYRYEVSLEPNQFNVLLALELPDRPPDTLDAAFLTNDYQLMQRTPIGHAINYWLESYPAHRNMGELSAAQRRLDLESYAKTRNPRSIALAHSLRQDADSDAAFVARVLDYLRQGGFTYTLEPALQIRDSVDELLFNTREGFCGHYASAFVLLMRAGGVPARVVTGYLGGAWNRYGGYLLIRQSDAHAWAEVWLDGQGWTRVDPTAVVAPQRLTRDPEELIGVAGVTRRILRATWITNTVQAWQAVNAWWQDEFVGFNFAKQHLLLERLGVKSHQLQALALLLAVGGGIWLGAIAWSLRPRTNDRAEDQLSRSWRALERKLRRAAAPRAPHEGPVAYAERLGNSRPELAALVTALARRYARLRYGPGASADELEQFRRLVRSLRPVGPQAKR